MKSFCVLNSPLNAAAGESMGKAATAVLGKKIGILCNKSSASSMHLAKGIKKAGGCAVMFDGCFESQVAFAAQHYALDGLFYISEKNSTVTAYGSDARSLSALQEDELAKITLENSLPNVKGGEIINTALDDSYYKCLIENSHSFENVCVKINCSTPKVSVLLKRALFALGGGIGGKIKFSLSSSGLVLSAVDEKGRVYSHSQLLDACAACEIDNGKAPELTFFSSFFLDELAKKNAVILERSFVGGNELWQRDAVFLAARLMHYISLYGCGLAAVCDRLPRETVKRKNFSSALSLSDIADIIECEELVTDCDCGVFARAKNGNLLVIPCSGSGKYCLEVQASNSEIADELVSSLTAAVCLT